MVFLVFGFLALVLGLWVLKVISRADAKLAARWTKAGGGLLALLFAALLGLRGEIGIAVPVGLFGLGLLGWMPFGMPNFGWFGASGPASRARSRFIELDLGADGAMSGRVVAGRLGGQSLDAIDVRTLVGLLGDIDGESQSLLVAYLDRRHPGWREHAKGDAASWRRASSTGKMSKQEAHEILGLQTGATAADIVSAHRRLMKRVHPDQGGSNYLAARINEAKDVLMQ